MVHMMTIRNASLDLEVRPYVGKVSGADLIDVTDRYWEKLYNTNPRSNAVYCYIARDMAVDGEYPLHAHYTWELPCETLKTGCPLTMLWSSWQARFM